MIRQIELLRLRHSLHHRNTPRYPSTLHANLETPAKDHQEHGSLPGQQMEQGHVSTNTSSVQYYSPSRCFYPARRFQPRQCLDRPYNPATYTCPAVIASSTGQHDACTQQDACAYQDLLTSSNKSETRRSASNLEARRRVKVTTAIFLPHLTSTTLKSDFDQSASSCHMNPVTRCLETYCSSITWIDEERKSKHSWFSCYKAQYQL